MLSQSHWEATYSVSVRLIGILPAGMLLKFLDQFLLGAGETCCVLVGVSAESECLPITFHRPPQRKGKENVCQETGIKLSVKHGIQL